MIVIRRFQPHDFQAVIDIERRVFNEHNPYLYMQFYETCSDGFIVALINGFVVGYIVGFMPDEKTGRIFSLAVHPAYQNRGVGSALLKEIISFLAGIGASRILLEVRLSNIRARRFYERHGFCSTGIAQNYYNDGEDAVLMELRTDTAN